MAGPLSNDLEPVDTSWLPRPVIKPAISETHLEAYYQSERILVDPHAGLAIYHNNERTQIPFRNLTSFTPYQRSEQSLPTAMPTGTSAPIPTSTSAQILASTPAPWLLVEVGDSIPFSKCFGCKGFVDRYAIAITEATGHPVTVQNLAEHNGLQIDGLLEELKTDTTRREALANADIIIVGIAANDIAMNSNVDLCDGPNPDIPDWSKYNADCAAASAELFRPKFEGVFSQMVTLRGGKPTIFRTINRYNDWIGWPGHGLPPEGIKGTRLVLDAWNEMICQEAEEDGFVCADIYHAFNGPDGLTPSANLVAADYTHPSYKGNQVISRVLTDLGFAPLADHLNAGNL